MSGPITEAAMHRILARIRHPEMRKENLGVGVLDADVRGPSIPRILKLDLTEPRDGTYVDSGAGTFYV